LQILVVTENGLAKKPILNSTNANTVAASGIKTLKVTPKTGANRVLARGHQQNEEHDMVVISKLGQTLRTPVGKISTLGRATQGVRVMTLDSGR
jgi:DNA gyrase subunit A